MSCVGSRLGALRKKSLPRSWDALRGSAWDAVVKLLPFVQIISLNKDPKTQDSERIPLGLSLPWADRKVSWNMVSESSTL